jgi:hypothetical protein
VTGTQFDPATGTFKPINVPVEPAASPTVLIGRLVRLKDLYRGPDLQHCGFGRVDHIVVHPSAGTPTVAVDWVGGQPTLAWSWMLDPATPEEESAYHLSRGTAL